MNLTEHFLTPEEVAKMLKVDKRTVFYWIKRNQIDYIRINDKVVRFAYSDILDFLKKHKVKSNSVDDIADEILSKII